MATKTIRYNTGKDGYISSVTKTKKRNNGTVITKTKQIKNKQKIKDQKAEAKDYRKSTRSDSRAMSIIENGNSKRIDKAKSRISNGNATRTDNAIEKRLATTSKRMYNASKPVLEDKPKTGNYPQPGDIKKSITKPNIKKNTVKKTVTPKKSTVKRDPENEYGYDYNGSKRKGSYMGEGKAIEGYFAEGGQKKSFDWGTAAIAGVGALAGGLLARKVNKKRGGYGLGQKIKVKNYLAKKKIKNSLSGAGKSVKNKLQNVKKKAQYKVDNAKLSVGKSLERKGKSLQKFNK